MIEAPSDKPAVVAPLPEKVVSAESVQRRTQARLLAKELSHSKTFLVGSGVLAFWVLDAALWPLLPILDPQAVDPNAFLQGPSGSHWFGTDTLGRDVFARVLAGATPVLTVAPAATALALAGGAVIGLACGLYRGVVDEVAMRVVDALLSFPLIVFAVLILAVVGGSLVNVILIIAIAFTPVVARTVRAAALAEREREYVSIARLRGETGSYIMFAEILPNISSPLIVEGTVRLGYAIFVSATLSFLSLGVQQPSPDWGLTISLGREYLQVAPWTVLFPAGALASLVVSVNLIADAVRQATEQ